LSARVSSCLAILAMLAGCASTCPNLPGGPRYCLQGTAAVPPHVALQDIRIRRGDLDERVIAQLEVDAEGMRLAGLTPMGQRVLEATFDNRTAWAESLAGDRLDARALLALVQLATWPADVVRAGLGDGCILQETPVRRRLLREGRLILDVVRTGEPPIYRRIEISLPDVGMTVTVREIKDE